MVVLQSVGSVTLMDSHWEYAARNKDRLLRMFLRVARGDRGLAEEIYSEVAVERLPRIFELYDFTRPVDNYVLNSLRWYAIKWMAKRDTRAKREASTEIEYSSHDIPSWAVEFDGLDDAERTLMSAVHEYGMTFAEIAHAWSWPVQTVRQSVKHCHEKLRCGTIHDDWFFVKEAIRLMVSL